MTINYLGCLSDALMSVRIRTICFQNIVFADYVFLNIIVCARHLDLQRLVCMCVCWCVLEKRVCVAGQKSVTSFLISGSLEECPVRLRDKARVRSELSMFL